MKKDAPVSTRNDPVCGMLLSQHSAAYEFQYAGKTYYLCSSVCRDAFETDPEKYLRHRRKRREKTTNE